MCSHPPDDMPDDMKDQDGLNENTRPRSHDKEEDNRLYKGLCMNCAHRHYCLLPRPESGVWHCEEYDVG